MNYIREMNAFYDWLETNSISSSAIVLWHALMSINNKCGWIPEFTVAASVLEVKTGLKRRSIERARNELAQKNRITWKSRKGNQSALYQIVSLCDAQIDAQAKEPNSIERQVLTENDVQVDVQVDVQPVAQCDAQVVAINKLKETKLKETKHNTFNHDVGVKPNNIWDAFLKAFGKQPTPIQIEKINNFIDQDHLAIDLICYGLLKTGERGMPFNYAEEIFKSWLKKGIYTYDQAIQEQSEYQHKKHRKQNGQSNLTEVYKVNSVVSGGTASNLGLVDESGKLYDWLNE